MPTEFSSPFSEYTKPTSSSFYGISSAMITHKHRQACCSSNDMMLEREQMSMSQRKLLLLLARDPPDTLRSCTTITHHPSSPILVAFVERRKGPMIFPHIIKERTKINHKERSKQLDATSSSHCHCLSL